MKFDKITIFIAESLRRGLFLVCFSAMLSLSGCGREDTLLSELRREEDAKVSEERSAGADRDSQESGTGEKILVHVCGAVKNPGVYELSAGSRFYEAVEAAGGFSGEADKDYLNMASVLSDGSRLEIPTLDEAKERELLSSEQEGLVNINTADVERLCDLPGVGEGRAKAIVEYRERQGGFQKKEDIMQVSGIGEKMYERMEAYLAVE